MKNASFKFKREIALASLPAFAEAEAPELRLLCAALLQNEAQGAAELSAASGLSADETAAAIAYWRGAGVLISDKKAPVAPTPTPTVTAEPADPYRSSEYLAQRIEDGNLRALLSECARIYGQMPSKVEIETVLYLLDACGLEADFILTLFSYCYAMGKKSYRYAERVAKTLTDSGIHTVSALDAYIQRQNLFHSAEGKIRRLFGLGERALTAKESEHVTTWVADFKYDEDVIGLAYDITVNNSGKASIHYAHKILADWHTAGVRSLSEAQAHLEREREKKAQKYKKPAAVKQNDAPRMGNFDTDDFFNRAVQRSYEKFKKKEEEQKG